MFANLIEQIEALGTFAPEPNFLEEKKTDFSKCSSASYWYSLPRLLSLSLSLRV